MNYLPLKDRVVLDDVSKSIPSGFSGVDEVLNGGFRLASTYLIAGVAKCGKSSLLMNIVNYHLGRGRKVAYFDTELTEYDFVTRMAGVYFNQKTDTVNTNSQYSEDWLDINNEIFSYSNLKDPVTGRELSMKDLLVLAESFVANGAEIICFDNLTTFSNNLINGKQGWELLNSALDSVIKFAKKHSVICFCVIHTKRGQTYKETPQGIRDLAKSGNVGQIFNESITVVAKPSVDDIYGGSSKTHVDGAFLIWRPLQFYPDNHLNRQTLVILEQFRNNRDGAVLMDFDGEKKIFTEIEPEVTGEVAEKIFNSGKDI